MKIPLNPVRWRNLSNGVNPPFPKGELGEEYALMKGGILKE